MHADTLFTNAQVYDSAFKRFRPASVSVLGGRVLYVAGEGFHAPGCDDGLARIEADEVVDCEGKWLVPGLIDIHMHIESSMICPPAFSRELLRNGVTTCVAEPHEIANVFGVEGIREFIRLARGCDADIYFGAPSSVPSTPFETTGAEVSAGDIRELMGDAQMRCLGEVMDCRTLIADPTSRIAGVVRAAEESRTPPIIEGHVPAFTGLDLARIAYAGVDSDHCEQTPERIRERVEAGVLVEVQMKSVTQEVVDYLTRNGLGEHFCFVTDDVMVDKLVHGHLNRVLARAVSLGMRPEDAVYAATAVPARRMDLRDRGLIAPGRLADFALLDSLETFDVAATYKRGRAVDVTRSRRASHDFPEAYYASVHLGPLTAADFALAAPEGADADGRVTARCMGIQERSTFTEDVRVELDVSGGLVDWKAARGPEGELLALGRVFERHHGTGNVGTALYCGRCLQRGAVASTWVHDHHNLLVIGRDEADMALAANTVAEAGGGICAVEGGRVLGFLPLPVAGILTEAPVEEAAERLAEVTEALRELGWGNVNPVMSVCTTGLPVSPALKVTDRGLVDVRAHELVPLFV